MSSHFPDMSIPSKAPLQGHFLTYCIYSLQTVLVLYTQILIHPLLGLRPLFSSTVEGNDILFVLPRASKMTFEKHNHVSFQKRCPGYSSGAFQMSLFDAFITTNSICIHLHWLVHADGLAENIPKP